MTGRLVAGLGFSSQATANEVIALITAALTELGHDTTKLAVLATLDDKAKSPLVRAAAEHFAAPVAALTHAELAQNDKALVRPSLLVQQHTGLAGIAEAAALHFGPLILAKQKSANATCALSYDGRS